MLPKQLPCSRNLWFGILRDFFKQKGDIELNSKTAHRTHNNTVLWFILLQSNSQNCHELNEKTSKEDLPSLYFFRLVQF